jgi:flagella basal body P-ring formation protein FlgA
MGVTMKSIAIIALALAAPLALAQPQNLPALTHVVQQFLQTQTAGLPGQVKVTVSAPDARLALPSCPAPEAFLQPGARAWGNTTVGVRCTAPVWTIYMQAQVSVTADYVASALPLAQGQPIEAGQLVLLKGDIAAMPAGILTDIGQAVGRSPLVSLPAGVPLRTDSLKRRMVVQQGQAVRLVSTGANFSVSSEAKALANAGEGQVVQVRTASGSVISGTAQANGVVAVTF